MVGISERNEQKQELARIGYSLKYIDEWQPKTTLYRHKAALNSEGEVSGAIGSYVENVPGSPDYVLRKAKIGLFPWMPGDSCTCKWCLERRQSGEPVGQVSQDTSGAAGEEGVEEGVPATPISRKRESGQKGPYYQAS
jgi:hypothetical protein